MTELFLSILGISLSVSLVIVLLLLLSPLLNRRYAAKWKYLIWIFLAVRLLFPFGGVRERPVTDMLKQWRDHTAAEEQAEADTGYPDPASGRVVVEIPAQMTTPLAIQAEKSITLLDVGVFLWAAGGFIFIAIHMISYLHYKRQVMKEGIPVKKVNVLQQFLKIRRELYIRHTVPVIEFQGAASPMILGFLRPVLVLPDLDFCDEELYFILKHELVHLKRGDVYWKLLFMAANGVHWFNPLVWIMRKEAVIDMELSCDEKVTQGADFAMKRAYTETLLSTLHNRCGKRTDLSTGFYGGKKIMKKRFKNILGKNGKKSGFTVLACIVILTVGAGMLVGCSVGKEDQGSVSEEQTENTAFANMAGSWIIDFDRTDPMIWGTGISYGDGMEISETGEFSYYIGIGVGGTGQCEEEGGVVTVEITPYEEHSSEKEILTLEYENPDGTESILMNWYEEAVYWIRKLSAVEETVGEDNAVESGSVKESITLSITKEGITEEKPASLVVEDRYILYLPDGEWQKAEADEWRAVANEDVRIWTAVFEGGYPIERILTEDGYVSDGERLTKQEDGISHHIRLYEMPDEIWLVGYYYPVEAEEGWGRELPVIADTFAVLLPGETITENYAVSTLVLGYISGFGNGTVTVDRQDWVTFESPDWKPEYDADAGFEIVDLEGGDVTYPIRSDCTYHILENHQGESLEVDEAAFQDWLRETEFAIFWGIELEDGEVVSISEWYRP